MKNKMIVISGLSGAGKTSLIKEVLKNYPGELVRSVTTRKSRGVDDYYYHISDNEFDNYPGGYLETNIYNGKKYGTPKDEMIRIFSEGKVAILDVDVNGYQQIREKKEELDAEIVSVFILASPCDIYTRLLKRNTDTIEAVVGRMKTGLSEISGVKQYDNVIWNDTIDEAAKNLLAVLNGNWCTTSYERLDSFEDEMEELLDSIPLNQ